MAVEKREARTIPGLQPMRQKIHSLKLKRVSNLAAGEADVKLMQRAQQRRRTQWQGSVSSHRASQRIVMHSNKHPKKKLLFQGHHRIKPSTYRRADQQIASIRQFWYPTILLVLLFKPDRQSLSYKIHRAGPFGPSPCERVALQLA